MNLNELLLLLMLFGPHTSHRSAEARREFEHLHPCPATGLTKGTCSGYVMDHVIPLVCGGPDAASNIQWQTVAAAKAKDRWERIGCSHGVKTVDMGALMESVSLP